MTPDEIARARELAELCLSLEAEGKANVTEATFARYALRALDALEASRRECEELRAENRLFIRVGREVQRKAKDLFEAAMGAPC